MGVELFAILIHERELACFGGATPPSSPYEWFGSLIAEHADASGLMYRRNRYYDPQSGRFTTPDPIGVGGGLNAYGFAGGDPVSYSDPFGLCPAPDGQDDGKPCPASQILHDAIRNTINDVISTLGDIGNSLMAGLKSLGKEAAIQGALALATGGVGAEAEAGVTLFRAVDVAEAADIASAGVLKTVGSSVEGKYFAESAADAAKWGEKLYGAGKFEIVEARFSAQAAKQMYRWERLDAIGPARFAPSELLKNAVVNFVR